MTEPEILGRADTPQGDLLLRRREGVEELVVNGVFAMDSAETSSERQLADAAGERPGRVLVGGLGLGFTTARLLDRGADRVDVVELAEPLIAWARAGATPTLARVARDPRVHLHHGDIADAISTGPLPVPVEGSPHGDVPDATALPATFDAIVLDVDNGPTFLIHEHNSRIYREDWLAAAFARLAPGGRLLIWCEASSPNLTGTLAALGPIEEIPIEVRRSPERTFAYVVYRVRKAPSSLG